jgi:chromosome segregation ATPase
MNNFGSENMGVLLHKLTKYQTLLANCGVPAKSAIYNQKIDYYSKKLNHMGVSQTNLKNMRNLIGGMPENVSDDDANANIRALEALLSAQPSSPVADPNNDLIEQINTQFQEILTKHSQNMEKINALNVEKSAINSQLAEKIEELRQKTNKILLLTTERDQKDTDLRAKLEEIQTLTVNVATLNTQKNELEAKITGKESIIAKQNSVIQQCTERLTSTNRQPQQANSKATQLLTKMQQFNTEMNPSGATSVAP